MNPKWLVPISLVLGLGLLGVAGATKPLQYAQLWLDQRDSPSTATASALAPLIDCVNRIDRDTRLAYYRLHAASPQAPEHDNFGDRNEPEPRIIQASVCSSLYTLKLERQQPGSPLIGLASVYAYQLQKLTSLTDKITAMPPPDGVPQGVQQMVAEAMNKPLLAQLVDVGEDYLAVSTGLRNQLEREDLSVRPAQLARIEARMGRDLHWHVLNYMIAARHAVDRIERDMRDASLTPQTVADLAAAVQAAADNGNAYKRLHPGNPRDEEASNLWYTISPAAEAYLAALTTLRQDWLAHAAPPQLSEDYYVVTRRYDALLSYYNRLARNAF